MKLFKSRSKRSWFYILFSAIAVLSTAHAKNFKPTSDFPVSDAMTITKGKPNENCPQFQIFGFPSIKNSETVKRSYFTCRLAYAGQYDPQEKTPLWVAEHLTAQNIKGEAERDEINFIPDPQIPKGLSASDSVYSHSNYQRGHMAPAADFKYSQLAMNESFFYSNAVPQDPYHNTHIWNYLESSTREIANRRGELFVITGPIYSSTPHLKLRDEVSIPDSIFKVLIDPKTKAMTAFVIPNNNNVGDDFNPYQISVREVEKLSGINFNPTLSKQESDKYEVGGGDWIMPKPRKRNRN